MKRCIIQQSLQSRKQLILFSCIQIYRFISISIVIVNNILILCNERDLFYNARISFCAFIFGTIRNYCEFPLYFRITIVRITNYMLCFAYIFFAYVKSILLIFLALKKSLHAFSPMKIVGGLQLAIDQLKHLFSLFIFIYCMRLMCFRIKS